MEAWPSWTSGQCVNRWREAGRRNGFLPACPASSGCSRSCWLPSDYGVLACGVTQRTREIGVRMALGAQRREVLGFVLHGGMKLVSLGIVLGLAGAFALTRFLRAVL